MATAAAGGSGGAAAAAAGGGVDGTRVSLAPSAAAPEYATTQLKARLRDRERRLTQTPAAGGEAPTQECLWCTNEFIQDIPKTDVHVHLDGSLRVQTVIDLSKAAGLDLPAYDEKALREKVFKPSFASLEDYLQCFAYTTAVMQTAANLERVAYEFAADNFAENVRYFEVRFAPQLHCSAALGDELGIVQVLEAVDRGLRRAQTEFNARLLDELVGGGGGTGAAPAARCASPTYDRPAGDPTAAPPYFAYGIIVSAMRLFVPGMSRYYDAMLALHQCADRATVTAMASTELVQAAKKARDELGLPIVAVDIAGAERDHKATVHKKAFELAHGWSFGKTVHAGEGFGPESIWQAIRDLHAERIGHGYHIFSADQIVSAANKADPEAYVETLVKFASDRRITMEVCLTSNLGTMPDLKIEDHAFGTMVKSMLSVCLNTDNRLVSNTSMCNEIGIAVRTFGLSAKQLRDIIFCGIKRSFFPDAYTDRRFYIRSFMNYYDAVAERHGVPGPGDPLYKVPHKVVQ